MQVKCSIGRKRRRRGGGRRSGRHSAASSLPFPSLVSLLLRDRSFGPNCDLCRYLITDDGYSCTTCPFYTHKQCAEVPPLIPLHPLSLSHDRPFFTCYVCNVGHDCFISFGCDDCGFFLDVSCALFPLPDPEGSSEGQIENPIHDHPLISFLADRRLFLNCECTLCHGRILKEEEEEEDAYMCVILGASS